MDKVKEWAEEHKLELAFAGTAIIFYRIGFTRGVKATDRAVCKLLNGLDRVASKINMGGRA